MQRPHRLPLLKDYIEAGVDISDRWSRGIEHDERSVHLMEHLTMLDYNVIGDFFNFKMGGDGDSGETLMYLMDMYFEWCDKTVNDASLPSIAKLTADEQVASYKEKFVTLESRLANLNVALKNIKEIIDISFDNQKAIDNSLDGLRNSISYWLNFGIANSAEKDSDITNCEARAICVEHKWSGPLDAACPYCYKELLAKIEGK